MTYSGVGSPLRFRAVFPRRYLKPVARGFRLCTANVLHVHQPPKGLNMNTDQVKGAVKEAAGKVQQKTGEVFNSPEQQAKGIAKQVEGNVQKNYGDAKEDVKDATRR